MPLNPFSKHDHSNFPGVLIPLSDAQRHPSIAAGAEEKKLDMVDSDEKGTSLPSAQYSTLTIEALRADVETDVAASGIDTAYDRM
jgi:hypothetical protein